MKKLVLLAAMLLAFALGSKAQTSLVATLSHDGTVTTFYSANGLKDAYAAAVDGDIITLSQGTYAPVSYINKNITIRGAGMGLEGAPTIINGDVRIGNSSGEGKLDRIVIEGIYFWGNLSNTTKTEFDYLSLTKCRITNLSVNGPKFKNGVYLNCIIDELYLSESNGFCYTTFINCVINSANVITPSSASFLNCYINIKTYPSNCTLTNCIISSSSNYYLYSSCLPFYCYYIGPRDNFFNYWPDKNNVQISSADNIFKENSYYELADEYSSSWIGNDGTQVGIYGGQMPFDPNPSTLAITKFNVAPKTTADGKLSVEIEVKSN